MTAAELAGGFPLPAAKGLPTHIEDLYQRRVSQLPRATQTLMLLAAADPSGDAQLVWSAALRLSLDPDALAPAVDAELLVLGAQIRFRHPLVRSAVYRAAPREQRQRVHAALAVVSHPDRDADRRAWHRALAAEGPDEDVAAELERSAGRAQARGGMAGAAAFLQRSAALTQDPLRHSHRALAAAQASLRAGAFDVARGLLLTAEAGPLDELGRARAVLLVAAVDAIREATGTQIGRHAALVLAALRGHEAEASRLIDGTTTAARAAGQGTALQYAHWASAVLLNGLGRYEEGFAAAVRATEAMPQLHIATWALSELVEAATRSGHDEQAEAALERLGDTTRVSRTDWSAGIHARSEALISEGAAAERCYRTAIEHLGRTRLRPDLARAHLLYGEWLRRRQRRVDARTQLRTAHELFVTIGMDAFAERARAGLLATGLKVRARDVDTHDDLTSQERHIAQLARQGLSDPEIGARLYLSSRTVEWHLHKVFTKLGVRSRRELMSGVPAPRSSAVR